MLRQLKCSIARKSAHQNIVRKKGTHSEIVVFAYTPSPQCFCSLANIIAKLLQSIPRVRTQGVVSSKTELTIATLFSLLKEGLE